MEKRFYYFAYGSNMNEQRMKSRCPSAVLVGKAVLPNFRLVERLYADVEPRTGHAVEGVVWAITKADVARLDGFEGVEQGVYIRRIQQVKIGGRMYKAMCYEMTPRTRLLRSGLPYPGDYRVLCSCGARTHGVADSFGKTA